MIKFTIGGKSFDPRNMKDALMTAVPDRGWLLQVGGIAGIGDSLHCGIMLGNAIRRDRKRATAAVMPLFLMSQGAGEQPFADYPIGNRSDLARHPRGVTDLAAGA